MAHRLKFKTILFFVCFVFIATSTNAQHKTVHISGQVLNNVTQKGVEGASIIILPVEQSEQVRKNIGISTNRDGRFDLYFNYEMPFVIKVTHVSFYPKELTVNNQEQGRNLLIELVPQVIEGDDIIVTADLISEKELKSSITIDRVSTVDVQQLASFDVFDLVSTLREVDIATQSMTMQSVNTRGFNSSANKRFLQLTDGIDNRAPGLSFPIGNLMGLVDLDISSVEILPGPSSTKYASSALNGVLLMNSRDPFLDQGLSIQSKGGLNDFNLSGSSFFSASGNGMMDVQWRYAEDFNDILAFKLTGSFTTGVDWHADNYTNIGFDGPFLKEGSKKHPDNPGYDGVNIYGDESSVYLPVYPIEDLGVGIGGNTILGETHFGPVTRTGYREEDLVKYDITTIRAGGGIHYKLSADSRIILNGRYGNTNSLYTGDSRIRLENFSIIQGSMELALSNLNLLAYSTWQNSGDSYDVGRLSRSLIQSAKADSDWYRDFLYAYRAGIPVLGVAKGSLEEAREFADSGLTLISGREAHARYEVGSKDFQQMVSSIKQSLDPSMGAAIKDDSRLYHLQGSYSIPEIYNAGNLEIGFSTRFYDLISQGTIFPDTTSNNITNFEYGVYTSLSNSLLNENLNVTAALRIDKNENFKARVSPGIAANYTPNEKDYFRISFQNGFRYPGVREQFINNELGDARILGGLSQNTAQYQLQENSIAVQSIDDFNRAVASDLNATPYSPQNYNKAQAELKNLQILEKGIIQANQLRGIVPERVNTIEIGFKRLFNPRLFLDLNYYMGFYKDFIGITRVVKPRTSPSMDLYTAAGQINSSLESDRFYVYSNARDMLIVQGLSFDLEYLSGGFMSSLNGSWSNLIKNSDDPIIPGFNTPPFKMNFEWGHRSISPDVGFKMVYRLRTKYYWQSSFLDGPIDTHGHFDIQINVRIPAARSLLKFGVTNWGIEKYYNIYGGPSVGSILFATFTFNPKGI